MKYLKTFLLLMLFTSLSNAQEVKYNIKDLYKFAYENNPAYKQFANYNEINSLKVYNISTEYYPKITFNGQATYQSEVTKISIPLPNFKPNEINKDQYKAYVDVRQIIFDGGNISSRKSSELTQLNINRQKIEVELFQLKQKINDIFFSILILQERKKIYHNNIEDLNARIAEMQSKVKNEIALQSNVYVLQAQVLQFEQEIESIEADMSSSLNMLSELTGRSYGINTEFEVPKIPAVIKNYNFSGRPEEKLYEFQKTQINSLRNIVDTKSIPRLSAFGQAGLGRPGLNMLDNTFQPYYMFGVNVTWNPFDWNANDNERKIYKLNENIIELQREAFEKNLKVSLEKYFSDISKYEKLSQKDKELILIREKIIETFNSQLQNGIITPTVYTTELNNLTQAQIQYQIHILQMLQAQINYLTAKGDF